jgi:hypothetical protein
MTTLATELLLAYRRGGWPAFDAAADAIKAKYGHHALLAALDEYEDRVRAGAVCIAKAREMLHIAESPKH